MSKEDEERRKAIRELLQKIVSEVAVVNRQPVRADDPVMVLPTIMKVLADDAAVEHERVLQRHANEYEDFAYRCRSDAKETAQNIINVSLTACRSQISDAADESAALMREAIKIEMAGAIAELRTENEANQRNHGPIVLAGGLLAILGGVAALAAVVLKIM